MFKRTLIQRRKYRKTSTYYIVRQGYMRFILSGFINNSWGKKYYRSLYRKFYLFWLPLVKGIQKFPAKKAACVSLLPAQRTTTTAVHSG